MGGNEMRHLQSYVYGVDPTLEKLSGPEKEKWKDAVGRATFSGLLITDSNKGMLDKMVESTYGDQAGQHPEFGQEIIAIAESL